MHGTAHESKENYRRYSTRWESASRKLAMPGEPQTQLGVGTKGCAALSITGLSVDLNTGHRVGAGRFIFGLGRSGTVN